MFHSIVAKFRNVSGVCEGFVKDVIRTNPVLPLNQITTTFQDFYSQDLRNSFFKEVNLYLDKAIYQYILGRRLLGEGNFSWGAVTQYYANFFAISGLIRLFEAGFSRIGKLDVEVQAQSNIYKIKKIKVEGLHRIVWLRFYSLYAVFDYKPHIFDVIYSPIKSEDYFYESDRRNEINYNPASGYNEIYQTNTSLRNLIRERTQDAYRIDHFERISEWVDLDNITQYRIRLLANIVFEIDRFSDFPLHAKGRFINRKNIIQKYEGNKKHRERFMGWLEGE